ncbi:MAG: large subunit ribosomal protein L18 [Candidatus Berkelbacteria bacterium Athens1014_28]|uniref:Large subunit ribosomal protein L18 n=1 Tax=Candidatus Berkelbacteria bacterium Athens1014_28 TaxID=2017145 RepID=A0A554LQZ5_9BACT|nr:MAG: large subunit ribosomal protein L18 [Candidatus Berkelbacteria bacterium Athens1014_28]
MTNLKQSKKNTSKISRDRLLVYSSNTNFFAQILALDGKVLVSANSLKLKAKSKSEKATLVGNEIAKIAKVKKIFYVFLDRNGKKYHGIIKAFAEAARSGGLKF